MVTRVWAYNIPTSSQLLKFLPTVSFVEGSVKVRLLPGDRLSQLILRAFVFSYPTTQHALLSAPAFLGICFFHEPLLIPSSCSPDLLNFLPLSLWY